MDKITEYLCEPLRKCLKDEDPYVRKTAAVCVAKLHDINAQMVEDQGFLDSLRDLIADSNPMVINFCFIKEQYFKWVTLKSMFKANLTFGTLNNRLAVGSVISVCPTDLSISHPWCF